MSSPSADRVLGGRYQLIREIARGGMATVWEARDELLDRLVAVKLLHPQYASEPEFLERFRREARAAARLSHPNIVSIYDVGEDLETHTPFIVMELVEGANLKDRIRRAAPLSDAEIRSIGAALAMTLEFAHQRGIIHRDVKPQNVLIGEDGRPRLTDFGIAQAMASSGLTRTGAVMGSVHYIAPELVRGRPATPQSDVYGLAAVLYEMATGRVPFSGDTDLAIALAHVEQTPPAPRRLNPQLSADLERTILRGLAKSPEQRFASAAELAAALRNTAAVPARGADPAATQRIPRTNVAATPRSPAKGPPPAAPAVARRTTRPHPGRGPSSGILVLFFAMAAVLIALGAGFFGLATLNRDGSTPPADQPTPAPTSRATAVAGPVGVPTSTPQPAATATQGPSATPLAQPSPSPAPSPSAAVSPSPPPASPTPLPQPTPTAVPTAAPITIPVPQLRGKTLDDAQTTLRNSGLTVIVRGVNANVDRNVVTDETPDVGTSLPPGGTVTILVGTGSTAVPDVSNMPRDLAVRTLQSFSFHAIEHDRRDPRVAAGLALGTLPQAGMVTPRNSEIELDVSAGR